MKMSFDDIRNTLKIQTLEIKKTAGLSTELTGSQTVNYQIITRLWKRFNRELHDIRGRRFADKNWEKFGITFKSSETYQYLAAVPYTDDMQLPGQMIRYAVSSGRYACFSHIGPMHYLKDTIYMIYRSILPELRLEPVSPADEGLYQFERYDARFDWNNEGSVIEIYIPLKGA